MPLLYHIEKWSVCPQNRYSQKLQDNKGAMKSQDLITQDLTTQHHIAGVDSERLENAGTLKVQNGNFDQMAADQCKVSYLNLYPFISHL